MTGLPFLILCLIFVDDISVFQSPYAEKPIDIANLDAESGYVFVKGLKTGGIIGRAIVVYEREASDDGMIYVGYHDCSAEMVDAEVLGEMLEEQRKMQEQQR